VAAITHVHRIRITPSQFFPRGIVLEMDCGDAAEPLAEDA
jgi:hypothetical protein